MENITFKDSLVKFIQEETMRQGWYKNGRIEETDVLTVIEALGEVTSTLAREVIYKE